MTLYQLRLTIDRSSLGQDSVVWGLFGIDTAVAPSTIIDDIRDAWMDGFGTNFSGSTFPLGHFMTMIEAYPAAGGPAAAISAIDPPYEMGAGLPLPAEVAVAISHEVDTIRGVRPVGRTYVGPLGVSWEGNRPAVGDRGEVGNQWVDFHEAVVLLGATPVVISREVDGAPRVAPIGLPIVRYSMDDAFDTQRRRGWDATSKETYTPA